MIGNVFKVYGTFGSLRLFRDVFLSRLLFSKVRIIRYPFYIRGVKNIDFGRNFTSGVNIRLDAFEFAGSHKPKLTFGHNCQVNDYVHIGCVESVEIGEAVLIASKVFITVHNHGGLDNIFDFKYPPAQ